MKKKEEDNNQNIESNGKIHHVRFIPELYRSWYLEYASYVILERAVPEIIDGLKPVQRRILHTMKKLDDGRYNKVANIIGFTMQLHPHGDASIGDALVALGQKDLLIDMQGNWGNILTGDRAAAPRYIEARLSKFSQEVMFSPKITDWKLSYDGRNKEPLSLPAKFPVLLASGSEGIAVGLASKILPHNFNEIIDCSIAHLKNKEFKLLPDFATGGMADFSKYNNGIPGGKVKVRARISKIDKKTLLISEIPYGKTSVSLIDSIISANEKGKIRIKKIDDNTSDKIEIIINLFPGSSPDKTIDALYAFTDCEISISPNCCVIRDRTPVFIGVSEILKASADNTLLILKKELEIRKMELEESWHMSSLEKIFIENRIYTLIEECETWESILYTIEKGLEPFTFMLKKPVTYEDIVKLTEIKIKRISKFNSFKADKYIKNLEKEIEKIDVDLQNIVNFTIDFYLNLKKNYGIGKERKTEIKSFDVIEASKVAEANRKLYVNKKEGFFGFSLKDCEFIGECSDIDDVIVFLKDGRYIVKKVAEKDFAGKDIEHIAVFLKNDSRTIYNAVYKDGKSGNNYVKRFAVTSITRDKYYFLTKGNPDSSLIYLTSNPNGEAEKIKVYLKPKKRLRKLQFDFEFNSIQIKGKSSYGNILTKHIISKILLKESGISTIGGIKLWFDTDIKRLNSDGRGIFLGEFSGDDKIIEITASGNYKLYGYDLANHFEEDLIYIKKFNPERIITIIYFEGEKKSHYIKRFLAVSGEKRISVTGDHGKSKIILITDEMSPKIEFTLKGKRVAEKKEIISANDFIVVKGIRARGKRISNLTLKSCRFIEKEELVNENKNKTGEDGKEIPGQRNLFS